MIVTLILKILRDVRLPLLVVGLLLGLFQLLWAKVTQRITQEILPAITGRVDISFLKNLLFRDSGKLIQTLMGGENIALEQPIDLLSVGYVHPLVVTILCIWAIGRSASAITGEIDRGTMELLLAQPVSRFRVVLAQLCVDLLTIPVLCLSLWAGNWLGAWCFGQIEFGAPVTTREMQVDPFVFVPALVNVAALLFAVSGYTLWLSSAGRFRGRILGIAILITLVQFLINVIGQLLDTLAFLRPFTVFYYFQPQQIILTGKWWLELGMVWNGGRPLATVNVLVVLLLVGAAGYAMAFYTFCRRDLPAPL
jgi:ABC-2 type transport system permease protein